MAPCRITDDYYKILGVEKLAGKDAIRASYKRLAMLHHPDRNPHNAQATAQFQLIEAAYSTLFDPEKRRIYDLDYGYIRTRSTATNNSESSNPPPQTKHNSSDNTQTYQILIQRLNIALQELQNKVAKLNSEMFEAGREYTRSQAALKRLQEEADRDAREEASRSTWFGFFFSERPSTEQKQARQRRMIDNRAAQTVREAELERRRAAVTTIRLRLDNLEAEIRKKVAERQTVRQREWEHHEAVRKAEQQRQQEQQTEKAKKARESAERLRREHEAKKAEEEKARKAREDAARLQRERDARKAEEERVKKAREDAARLQREQDIREEEYFRKWMEENVKETRHQPEQQQSSRKRAEASRKRMPRGERLKKEDARSKQSARATGSTLCLHQGWWSKEDGSHICERCLVATPRFAFQCPGCHMVACAGCRNMLKGRRKI